MKTTIKSIIAGFMIMLAYTANAQSNPTAIKGIVLDEEHNPAIGAYVQALQGGVMIKQTAADENGAYTLKPLSAGTYEVLVSFTGYKTVRYSKVRVEQDETAYLDVDLEINTLITVEITDKTYQKDLVEKSFSTIHKIDIEKISAMPVTKGDVKGMIANISTDILVSEKGEIYSRGSRSGSSKYFLDGDLMPFDNQDVCGMAIQSLSVITGGIPAQYGDLTGAAIIVNTRDYFTGIAEKNVQYNRYLDKVRKQKEKMEEEARKKAREEEIKKEKEKAEQNKIQNESEGN